MGVGTSQGVGRSPDFIGLWVGAAYTETFSFMSLCGLGEQICAALDVAF